MLEEDDLAATYACLKAWEEAPGGSPSALFAFFNSGNNSGASQAHRHLQFLPVADMHAGEATSGWDVLINSILTKGTTHSADTALAIVQHPDLPFTHFAHKFSGTPSTSQLLQVYNKLYQLAKAAVDNFIVANPGQLALHGTEEGDLPISYNLAMTTSGMAILPRRSEGYMLRHEDGTHLGTVELNGTALGGTLMVKVEDEWNVLKERPEALDAVVEAIGIPRTPQATKL